MQIRKNLASLASAVVVAVALAFGATQAAAEAPPSAAGPCHVTIYGVPCVDGQSLACAGACQQLYPENGGVHFCTTRSDGGICCTCAE